MIVHPLVLAVLGCDLGAVLLLLFAALVAARVLAAWTPDAATRAQLTLERHVEIAVLAGRAAAWLFGFGTLIWIVAIAAVLPALVPGAMCGTGVVQATDGIAGRAIALRLLALLLLGVWRLVERLGRDAPRAPLTPVAAKLALLAAPITVLAGLDTWRASAALDVHSPVDCCALVYELAAGEQGGAESAGLPDRVWVLAAIATFALLVVLALLVRSRAWTDRGLRSGLLAGAGLVWAFFSAFALIRVLSAYHYGVLEHHCPWCLMLPEHHLVGFPLYAALAAGAFEAIAACTAVRIALTQPVLAAVARRRARTAALRVLLALVVFGVLAFGPALLWRLQHGVWIGGG